MAREIVFPGHRQEGGGEEAQNREMERATLMSVPNRCDTKCRQTFGGIHFLNVTSAENQHSTAGKGNFKPGAG